MMNTKKIKTFLAAALFLLSACAAPALAGDYATLNFVGFSADGQYLAFEEYGTTDAVGYPYSNYYFVDVEKNAYAAAPVKVTIESETATEKQARTRSRTQAAKRLREFRIVEGTRGKHVVSRLLTEFPVEDATDEMKPEKVRFAEEIGSMWRKGDYTLTLAKVRTMTKDCEIYELPMYKLEMTLRDNERSEVKTLQKDVGLPASRGCTMDYGIQDVYIHEDNIAVFLNVYTPGFEGGDMRYMVVTGRLY